MPSSTDIESHHRIRDVPRPPIVNSYCVPIASSHDLPAPLLSDPSKPSVSQLGTIYKERCIVGLKSRPPTARRIPGGAACHRLLRNLSDQIESPVRIPHILKIPSRQFSISTLQPPPCLSGGRGKVISVFHGPTIKSVFIHNLTGQDHPSPLAKKRKGCHFFWRIEQAVPSFVSQVREHTD